MGILENFRKIWIVSVVLSASCPIFPLNIFLRKKGAFFLWKSCRAICKIPDIFSSKSGGWIPFLRCSLVKLHSLCFPQSFLNFCFCMWSSNFLNYATLLLYLLKSCELTTTYGSILLFRLSSAYVLFDLLFSVFPHLDLLLS